MIVSDCIYQIRIGGCKSSSLNANTLEEKQLIDAVQDLLYETKSIKSCIEIITNKIQQIKDFDKNYKHIQVLTVNDLDHSTLPLLP